MCLYSKLVMNPKFKINKKNGGVIPAIDDIRKLQIPIKCGNCIECRKAKAREWQIRLLEDVKVNKNGVFVTLTLSLEKYTELSKKFPKLSGYNLDNEIMKTAVRRFNENWRKKYKKSPRHWLITEIGGNRYENIHTHGIIWCDDMEKIGEIWGNYGFSYYSKKKNVVNEATVNYITKYVTKKDPKHQNYKSIILCSNGIGKSYIEGRGKINNEFKGIKTEEAYISRTGHKLNLPTYYRNNLFTEEERQTLWSNKIDKNVIYINGVEYDRKNEELVTRILEHYRKENIRKGYGSDKIDIEKKMYELAERKIKNEEKIKMILEDKKNIDEWRKRIKPERIEEELPKINLNDAF